MNYMPTKSRKWLASGIATAVIASALSLFTVAPASAAVSVTAAVSKAVRATNASGVVQAVGTGSGTSSEDTAAVVISLDDSFGDLYTAVGDAGDDDTKLYVRVTSTAANSSGTANQGVFTIQSRQLNKPGHTSALTLNTWLLLDDSGALMSNDGTDDTLSADDTQLAFNFYVNLTGTYVLEYLLDIDGSGTAVPSAGDRNGSITIVAYGAPTATITSTVTSVPGADDTLTLTLTGGALAVNEVILVTDDSLMNTKFRTKAARTTGTRATLGGADVEADDTLTLSDTYDWVRTGADTSTLTIVVVDTATNAAGSDRTGTVKAWFSAGFGTPGSKASAATATFTATTTVSAIQDMAITAPTANIILDDTPAAGVFNATALKTATTSGSTVNTGTFQLTNASDYGKVVNVNWYDETTPTASSTAEGTLAVTSSSATGIGSWTFTIRNEYLDTSGDVITFVAGNISYGVAAAGASPKFYTVTITSANPTPVWTVNGLTWKSSESFPGTLIAAVGGTITASVKAQDQYGNALTGQSIVLTTSSTQRNASKRVQSAVSGATGVVSVSMTDAGTAVSTTTATTRDAITLSLVDGLEDDTVGSTESVTVAYYTANTLTAPTTNGVAAAAYDGEPVVPGDGTADAYSSAVRDGAAYDDSLMKFDVTSSVLGASVVFTGTSGVRFYSADTVAPIAGSNIGGTDTATTALKGINKVVVASNSTTGIATVYWYCVTTGTCTVTATAGAATASASATYSANAAFARNVVDVKVNDVVGTTGTSTADKKVKVSFKVTDIFGNAVKTFGETPTVDVMVSGVGSIDGLGSQGTLKTGTDGTAQFYAASSAAGSMQITLDGTGGQFAGVASTTLGTSAAADKKTVTITWSAAPVPEVVYAAPTLTVTKSGTKIILDGTAVEGEGDIIVYIKRVGTTKWVEQAATIEVAAPGDYNGMRIAPKSNVLIRVKQEGTGKFSNQGVVLK